MEFHPAENGKGWNPLLLRMEKDGIGWNYIWLRMEKEGAHSTRNSQTVFHDLDYAGRPRNGQAIEKSPDNAEKEATLLALKNTPNNTHERLRTWQFLIERIDEMPGTSASATSCCGTNVLRTKCTYNAHVCNLATPKVATFHEGLDCDTQTTKEFANHKKPHARIISNHEINRK